jgi:CheY-like chemotaxis protein
MSDLRILVVENNINWQDELRKILQRLGPDVHIDVCSNYNDALPYARHEYYDLAIIDLALLIEPSDSQNSDQLGMDLLRELRNSSQNRGCGLLVLSGYVTKARTRLAFRDYDADDVIDKNDFDNLVFINTVRETILNARLRQAASRNSARYYLNITFNYESLLSSELTGPNRRALHLAEHPLRFDASDLARRADNLNLLVLRGGAEIWRPEASSIGTAIYNHLSKEGRVLADLTSARALAQRLDNLWLQFTGPATGLGIPFELLRDADDYLALDHVLTRRIIKADGVSRNLEQFHSFIHRMQERSETLRILIVGANHDGAIPLAEDEAVSLYETMRVDLQRLGLRHEILLLVGSEATYSRVRAELRYGGYHIFHYAGHGSYQGALPESSGLILKEGTESRVLTAAELNLLLRDLNLQMVFLSCCLGARTATQIGRGDFYGMLEAIARADVPTVLGYRWTVADRSAIFLAKHFYNVLWRTFSPGDALLAARRDVAMEYGRDDETWASPVLLMQNV